MRRHRVTLVFAFVLALSGAASAWQVVPPANPPTEGAGVEPSPSQRQQEQPDPCSSLVLKDVEVTAVWLAPPYDKPTKPVVKHKPRPASGEPKEGAPVVMLRDTIGVAVSNLKKLNECLEKQGGDRNIVLYLDRRPLTDVVAHPPNDPVENVLMFPLKQRTEASRDVWTYLLGWPTLHDRDVQVSVGIDNRFAMPSTKEARIYLRVIPYDWFAFWVLIFGVFLVGFFILARRSDVLRDPVTAPYGARPPYSLARTQAAFWFFLILASYLLIGMVTGDFLTSITGTTLVLLGISAGTAAGSAFIDVNKSSRVSQAQDNARATVLWDEIEKLKAEVTALDAAVRASGDPAKAEEMAKKEALRLEKLSIYRKLTNQSEKFLLDILSDSGGVNFHRFQAAAWTVVLGIIFVCHVYRDLAMPQLNETLLGLMGISSATYLSLKIPQSSSPDPVPPLPAAPPDATPPNPATPPGPVPPAD